MAHGAEDCATVLEHFVHDAANLPAEIQHLMEEIQAKDKIMQECRATINSRDGSIQKFIKANGSLAPNVKEEQYSKQVIENLDRSYQLQDEKIKLSDRACVLLDRQIKRLDDRIRVLVNEGLLSNDPPLPSLSDTNQKNNPYRTLPRVFSDSNVAESTPGSDRKHPKSTEKENPIVEAARNLVNRTGGAGPNGFPSDIQVTARASAPGTPSGLTSAHSQQDKEKGVDNKRLLRLGQQPIGSSSSRPGSRPGTPKPGTPVPSRAGSVPPRVTAVGQKPPKIAPHHKVKQLKAASLGKRRKPSPSAGKRVKKVKRSLNGEGEEDDDSLLSSADMSDSDKSDTAGGDDDMDDDDEDEGIEDTKVYCTCRNVSHGDMVACDNDDCPYEWFHWKCVGLTREPTGTWYCDECRKSMVK